MHSRHSGSGHFLIPGPCGCCGAPESIYRTAKARGMDLVTLTDLDTIDGCLEFLDRYPDARDFFVSEEVTAVEPRSGSRLHVLVYDISEAQHREIQRRRESLRDLMEHLCAEGICASLGPLFGRLRDDAWADGDVREILGLFDRFELRNGSLRRSHGELLARLVRESAPSRSFGITGGSGSHGPTRVGRTTTVSYARSREEFLADLRDKRTWAGGREGSAWSAASDLPRIVAQGYGSLIRGKPAPVVRRRRHGGAGALVALPVHLSGLSLLSHALRLARVDARIRRARKRLDRIDVRRFKEKTRSYAPEFLTTGTDSGESST